MEIMNDIEVLIVNLISYEKKLRLERQNLVNELYYSSSESRKRQIKIYISIIDNNIALIKESIASVMNKLEQDKSHKNLLNVRHTLIELAKSFNIFKVEKNTRTICLQDKTLDLPNEETTKSTQYVSEMIKTYEYIKQAKYKK